ncbi:tyrosine-protein phosphatase [Gordonia humi]|uniref:Protein-tyrosine phosphatase n=1 Tax=Gordonia humi TaxID=686429 RepID=A0A840EV99_9ACTN|nr:tyrosine-protein phosphatase [Gordonia humi]MBB4134274.1 protein-tyrosine phosphatase [Gordonia humi]
MTIADPVVDGVPNFRSLAGLTTPDGRRIREGVLYRTESLAGATPTGRRQLADLHIASMCDLRSAGEAARAPIDWGGPEPQAIRVETLPDARVAGENLIHSIMADPTGRTAYEVLLGNARSMPTSFGTSMAAVFDALLDEDRVPLAIGCVAGKDRTGFVTAVILSALGIEWSQIAADYLRSREYFTADRLYGSMVAWLDERPDPMITADDLHAASNDIAFLAASFEAIDTEFGGFDEYLRNRCGLDDQRRARLQQALLESAGT